MNASCRPLQLTGKVKRCLNLGSYNYLGFAAADDYCTPRVLDCVRDLGWSSCGSRDVAGAPGKGFGSGSCTIVWLVLRPHMVATARSCVRARLMVLA